MNNTAKLLLLAAGIVLPVAFGCPERYYKTPNPQEVKAPVGAESASDLDGGVSVEIGPDRDSVPAEGRGVDAGQKRVDVEVE